LSARQEYPEESPVEHDDRAQHSFVTAERESGLPALRLTRSSAATSRLSRSQQVRSMRTSDDIGASSGRKTPPRTEKWWTACSAVRRANARSRATPPSPWFAPAS